MQVQVQLHPGLRLVLVAMSSPVQDERIADRGPQLTAILWVLTGASTITVIFRFIARAQKAGVGWDDFFMLVALVSYPRSGNRNAILLINNLFFSCVSLDGPSASPFSAPTAARDISRTSWRWVRMSSRASSC